MAWNDIDLELLRCFLIVAETKSFTMAGSRLGRSQSAVSIRIHKLETLLDTALFVRNSRKVVLTYQGEALLPMARSLLALGEETVAAIRTPVLSGTLRVGFLEYLASHRIPEILTNIRRRLPSVDVQFHVGLSRPLLKLLDQGDIDVAIAMHYPERNDAIPLAQDKLSWMQGANGYEFKDTEDVHLCLLNDPCFYRSSAIEALDQLNYSYNEIITANSVHAVRSAVASGLGVTVLGESSIGGEVKTLEKFNHFSALPNMVMSVYGEDERKNLFADVLRSTLSEFIEIL